MTSRLVAINWDSRTADVCGEYQEFGVGHVNAKISFRGPCEEVEEGAAYESEKGPQLEVSPGYSRNAEYEDIHYLDPGRL